MFSKKKILITGANGFIGSHLLSRLCENGADVYAVSRSGGGNWLHKDGLRWFQADLAETSAVRKILSEVKPDIIIHLASHVAGARDLGMVLPTFRSNLMSTVNLLTIASEIGCQRIVLTGSMEEPESADPEAIPSSPYAVAKWAGSAYARMFHALYRLPVTTLRVFMVYGPAQKDLRKLIPYVILSLLRKEPPKLADGKREIDWIYVDDVVEAFLAAARAPNIEGRTIDVGSGALVSIRTVVEHLVHIINPEILPLFGSIPIRPLEQVRVADLIHSKILLGWRPITSLETGLKKTVDWYERQLKE